MEQADIGRTDSNAESTASGGKLILHSFPSENPSELELRRWIESVQDRLRAARLLPYALSGTPTATTEYAAKNLIPTPITGTAETITNGILSKNMQITADNADRVVAWGHRVRDKNDTIAAALQLSLRSSAPGRLAALERAHAMISPNEHMLDGGAMFRALKGLQGHLDTEEEAKLAKKQVDFFLDPKGRLGDNVSANQFDERVNEFDVHVNPATRVAQGQGPRGPRRSHAEGAVRQAQPNLRDLRAHRAALHVAYPMRGVPGPTARARPQAAHLHLRRRRRLPSGRVRRGDPGARSAATRLPVARSPRHPHRVAP